MFDVLHGNSSTNNRPVSPIACYEFYKSARYVVEWSTVFYRDELYTVVLNKAGIPLWELFVWYTPINISTSATMSLAFERLLLRCLVSNPAFPGILGWSDHVAGPSCQQEHRQPRDLSRNNSVTKTTNINTLTLLHWHWQCARWEVWKAVVYHDSRHKPNPCCISW